MSISVTACQQQNANSDLSRYKDGLAQLQDCSDIGPNEALGLEAPFMDGGVGPTASLGLSQAMSRCAAGDASAQLHGAYQGLVGPF
jgi:hypothetical protein